MKKEVKVKTIFFTDWLRALKAARANFLPASVIPFLMGTSYALSKGFDITGVRFIFGLVGVVSAHLAGNLCNDYFDHKSGADALNKKRSPFFGGSGFIQEGLLSAEAVLCIMVFFSGLALLSGIAVFIITKNPVFLLIMIIAGILTCGYTAGPLRLSYRRLGELDIFLLFGVVLVMGSFYLFAEKFITGAFLVALPISFLIAGVIACNEIPDFESDTKVNKRNLLSFFGAGKGYILYGLLICFSLLAIFLNIIKGVLPFYAAFISGFYLIGIKAMFNLKNGLGDIKKLVQASLLTITLHSLVGASIIFVLLIS